MLVQDATPPFTPTTINLDASHQIGVGRLPESLVPRVAEVDRLWTMHPTDFPEILIHGRRVRTPRWQRAFGRDYRFAGQVAAAGPIPAALLPFLIWAQAAIDIRLNGILVNWYDARLHHYIGRHRDSRHDLSPGAPIVTVSLGESRVFRLRPWPNGSGVKDVTVNRGTVVVLPYDTNLAWTHEVPHRTRDIGRRISLTFRGFES